MTIGSYSVTNDGPVFFFHTNANASQYKLISIDISTTKPSATAVIPERKDALLCDVSRVNSNGFVVQYKHNVNKDSKDLVAVAADVVLSGQG